MQTVIVKTYKGRQHEATNEFQKDAQLMSQSNYVPINQNYVQGSWSCGQFILAALLCFLIVGFIALAYMVIVKPKGVLTVTYEYKEKHSTQVNA
jgi:hypothetical protein